MKRLAYFILIAMTMSVISCQNGTKPNSDNKTTDKERQDEVVADTMPETAEQAQGNFSECDMAMLDAGKLLFYNSKTGDLIPFVVETDSVVNCVFAYDKLYYCVTENRKIVLKSIQLDVPDAQPVKEADWGLDYEKCVTETYGTVSPLCYYAGRHMLGLWHEFSWDSYELTQQKLFNIDTKEITDWDWEQWEREEFAQREREEEEQTEENYVFEPMEDELSEYLQTQEGNYWLVDGIEHVCLSNKIDFNKYVSDPEYASEREFNYISSSPDNLKVLYMAILEWGDYPHGILVISSTDGELQMPLEDTDCTGYTAEWLDDGSFVYVGEEPLQPGDPDYNSHWQYSPHCIKRIYPDGHMEIISHCGDFQVRQ